MATSLLSLQDLAAASAEGLSCVHLVKSECSYYHYLCDGVDDRVGSQCAIMGVWLVKVLLQLIQE